MGISFAGGAYNRATGTRGAFNALSDDLEREGHPPMVSISGDREPEDQERIWHERMTLAPGNRRVYGYRWWQGQKWYQIHPDTVAPPRTSNHEARRSNDLKWPYNSDTPAARRAKVLAKRHNITREGENFRELWHWTHWGPLGHIDTPTGSGAGTITVPEEEDMVNVSEEQLQMLLEGARAATHTRELTGGSITNEDKVIPLLRRAVKAAEATYPNVAGARSILGGSIADRDGDGKQDEPGVIARLRTILAVVQQLAQNAGISFDYEAFAAELAPYLELRTLSDGDLEAIATAAADEQDRRARERLEKS